jgi:hypothetical protein
LPAIQRYLGPRVKSVHAAAKSLGLEFLILSGKYGVLEPSDSIPCYDHLLKPSEVLEHSKLVADQLEALGVQDIIFFTRLGSVVEPYRDSIESACEIAGIALKCVYLPTNDA